jgi:hypothetical protein
MGLIHIPMDEDVGIVEDVSWRGKIAAYAKELITEARRMKFGRQYIG